MVDAVKNPTLTPGAQLIYKRSGAELTPEELKEMDTGGPNGKGEPDGKIDEREIMQNPEVREGLLTTTEYGKMIRNMLNSGGNISGSEARRVSRRVERNEGQAVLSPNGRAPSTDHYALEGPSLLNPANKLWADVEEWVHACPGGQDVPLTTGALEANSIMTTHPSKLGIMEIVLRNSWVLVKIPGQDEPVEMRYEEYERRRAGGEEGMVLLEISKVDVAGLYKDFKAAGIKIPIFNGKRNFYKMFGLDKNAEDTTVEFNKFHDTVLWANNYGAGDVWMSLGVRNLTVRPTAIEDGAAEAYDIWEISSPEEFEVIIFGREDDRDTPENEAVIGIVQEFPEGVVESAYDLACERAAKERELAEARGLEGEELDKYELERQVYWFTVIMQNRFINDIGEMNNIPTEGFHTEGFHMIDGPFEYDGVKYEGFNAAFRAYCRKDGKYVPKKGEERVWGKIIRRSNMLETWNKITDREDELKDYEEKEAEERKHDDPDAAPVPDGR